MKQVTVNTSSKPYVTKPVLNVDVMGLGEWAFHFSCVCCVFRDSCQRGWRLLYILTAFYRCSDVMKPFVLKFLQDACASPGVLYQGGEFKTSICRFTVTSDVLIIP